MKMEILNEVISWTNKNSGFLSLLLLIITIIFGFITPKVLEYFSKKGFRKDLKDLLIIELLANIDFVAQIHSSHNKNLDPNSTNLYVPTKSPRVDVIEKFIQYNIIFSLNKRHRESILNVYAQLEGLKREYYIWRENTVSVPIIIKEPDIYKQLSLPMTGYIETVMTNMIDLWIEIVNESGSDSSYEVVREINKVIRMKIKNGKWIRGCYKSSFYNVQGWEHIDKFDVIMCWVNDGSITDKEIIEIKSFIPEGGL